MSAPSPHPGPTSAAVWLFPLWWTILSSFKTSNVAIFERRFALPAGITFAN